MVAWPSTVNTKAYGMDGNFKSNIASIEFESGKERTYLLNSSARKAYTFKIAMRDTSDSSEFSTFLDWWENTLLSGTETFSFPDLITHSSMTEYKMTSEPSWSGQAIKEVSIEVVEA